MAGPEPEPGSFIAPASWIHDLPWYTGHVPFQGDFLGPVLYKRPARGVLGKQCLYVRCLHFCGSEQTPLTINEKISRPGEAVLDVFALLL